MGYNPPTIPREHNKYHGYTLRDAPNCPLKHENPDSEYINPYINGDTY